jgi:UDP-N-acetylglucosamine 2-epimerase (non-hydrolysing)
MTPPARRLLFVLGTRPEAIKLAPVILGARGDARFGVRVCATAQHRQMLDQVLDLFGIVPDVDLDLMQPGQTLAELTARLLTSLDKVLADETPDIVLVQGDTTTVLAASLAAFYRGIPVGHVEAGLRTGNRHAPFPEEINRVITSRLADVHYAPTSAAQDHLIAEGIVPESILVTGNTVIDALLMMRDRVAANPPEVPGLDASLLQSNRRMVLVTGHRRENFGAGFESICRALSDLASRFRDVDFVYPVHLNPNVQQPVRRLLGGHANIHLIDPVAYAPFVRLMDCAMLILTDSGGVQEEAPSLGKPVLVMRDVTERPEAVAAGTALLVGADRARIVEAVTRLLTNDTAYRVMAGAHNPFGDGRASARILDDLATRSFGSPRGRHR